MRAACARSSCPSCASAPGCRAPSRCALPAWRGRSRRARSRRCASACGCRDCKSHRRSARQSDRPGAMKHYARSLARNLIAGARLALFLPVRAFDYRASGVDYAVLTAFNLAIWLAAAWVRAGFQGELDAAPVPLYLGSIAVVLAAALAVAHIFGSPGRTLLIATALSASDALFEFAGLVLPGAAAMFVLAGSWIVSLRAVAVTAGRRRPEFLKGALAGTAMIAIGFFAFPRPGAWLAPPEEAAAAPLPEGRLFP